MTPRPLPIDPNPHIAAILLVTSSRAGPRLVLHYPPEPSLVVFSPSQSTDATVSNSDDNASASDGDTDASSDDDDEDDEQRTPDGLLASTELALPRNKIASSVAQSRDPSRGPKSSSPPPSQHGLFSPAAAPTPAPKSRRRLRPSYASRARPMDTLDALFGVSRDSLAKLMAPSGGRRAWNGRKLEVEARGRTFVGCPVFLRDDDGKRRGRGTNASSGPNVNDDDKSAADHDNEDDDEETKREDMASPPIQSSLDYCDTNVGTVEESDSLNRNQEDPGRSLERTDTATSRAPSERPQYKTTSSTPSVPISQRPNPGRRGVTDYPGLGLPESLQSNASEDANPPNALTMFNIALVLAPPPWEHQERVELAFEHVARPLARAVREAQRRRWLDTEVREVERWLGEWKREHEERSETQHGSQKPVYGIDEFLEQRSHLYRTLAGVYKSIAAQQVAYVDLKSTSSTYDAALAVPTLSLQIPMPLNRPWVSHVGETGLAGMPVSSAALTVSGELWRGSSRMHQDQSIEMDEGPSNAGRSERWIYTQDEDVDSAAAANAKADDYQQPLTMLDRYDAARVDTTAAQSISTHAALLLSYDVAELIAQLHPTEKTQPGPLTPLKHPHPFCGPLTYLIQALNPRRTLGQLARLYLPGLTLVDITFLSCVLIRLRVARAITPLHASSFFAVDPAADLCRLHGSLGEAFARRFCEPNEIDEGLPSLPALLSRLSGATPWAALIPTKDAKPRYMEALGWLARASLVVQIRTFAWVHVSAEVRHAVAAARAGAEADAAHAAHVQADEARALHASGAHEVDPSRELLMAAVDARRHSRVRTPASSDAGSSTGSVRTAVLRAGTPTPGGAATRASSHVSRPSVEEVAAAAGARTEQGSGGEAFATCAEDKSNLRAGLVRAPSRCSAFETQCLEYIGARLEGEEARRCWGRLVGYFDGETAVEEIAAIEGMKRKAVAAFVGSWVAAGLLKVVRHW